MLLSVLLVLRASKQTSLETFSGKKLHGWLIHLVSRYDKEKAQELHSSEEKPFTVSLLHPEPGTYWLRVTSFEEVFSSMLEEMLGCVKEVKFGHDEYEVLRQHSEGHTWAGRSTFDELYNDGLYLARKGERLVGLRFVTPTTFKLAGSRLNMPLPWPRLVFQSLANRWNAFSPIPLWIDWPDFERRVTVAKCDVRTRLLDFGHFRQVGFVGECWFLIDPQAKLSLRHALYTLAQFAFYAGVGRKTTMGMGMVRPL